MPNLKQSPQATRAIFTQGSIKQSPEGVQKPHVAQEEQDWSVTCAGTQNHR